MTPAQVWRAVAIFFTVLAALLGILFARMRWHSGVDFDVTGFFWLLQNMGRLSVLALLIGCSAGALGFWIRAYLEESHGERERHGTWQDSISAAAYIVRLTHRHTRGFREGFSQDHFRRCRVDAENGLEKIL